LGERKEKKEKKAFIVPVASTWGEGKKEETKEIFSQYGSRERKRMTRRENGRSGGLILIIPFLRSQGRRDRKGERKGGRRAWRRGTLFPTHNYFQQYGRKEGEGSPKSFCNPRGKRNGERRHGRPFDSSFGQDGGKEWKGKNGKRSVHLQISLNFIWLRRKKGKKKKGKKEEPKFSVKEGHLSLYLITIQKKKRSHGGTS